jgi:hypothetical protein
MRIKIPLYLFASLLVAGYSMHSGAESTFPTHCSQGEFPYLNAKMSRVHYSENMDHSQGYELVKNGKVLSICSDRQKEPLNIITYRYGAPGKVEIEIKGTVVNKVGIFEQSTSPHTGENVFLFRIGHFTYYVTEATAQGSGIGLMVFNSGKRIAYLFSGNDSGHDYESGLFEINFSKASSPIFELRESSPDPLDQ